MYIAVVRVFVFKIFSTAATCFSGPLIAPCAQVLICIYIYITLRVYVKCVTAGKRGNGSEADKNRISAADVGLAPRLSFGSYAPYSFSRAAQ